MGKLYKVVEIFGPTIQGEGTFAGSKVSFVRFAGCNLRCSFCDTDHNPRGELTAQEILGRIPKGTEIIVFSGGEPLMQLDQNLLDKLKDYKHHVETNGTIKTSLKFDHIVMSPKLSRAETKLEECDDLKLLFPTYNPTEWEGFKCKRKFLQPLEEKGIMKIQETLNELYRLKGWSLSVQIHKIIGVK